ncbi:MAG TPA: adenylate/guanylate cyclase domain-containing protein, partial [Spirochaetia bacterium]|nr:adenylate/guanylate cyclase domain-containing protein [Spirochaetia bacterium]
GQSKQLSIMFSDIKGFTSISEQLTPGQLVDELAEYFTALGNIIMKNGGTVDKYIGDAIMAFWNAPVELPRHAEQACRSALGMRKVLSVLMKTHGMRESSIFRTTTRIGIHTGEAVVGNMGSAERLNYTVLGDSVNLASRLEGLNKYYGTDIIVSGSTLSEATGTMVGRLLDRVAVKGRSAGIEIFELVGAANEVTETERYEADRASEAVRLFLNHRFPQSLRLINSILEERPADHALRIIAERCTEYLKNDPGKDWNGVYVHHEK